VLENRKLKTKVRLQYAISLNSPLLSQAAAYMLKADASMSNSSPDKLFGDADKHLCRVGKLFNILIPSLVLNNVLSEAENTTKHNLKNNNFSSKNIC